MGKDSLETELTDSKARLVSVISVVLGLLVSWSSGQVPADWWTPIIEAVGGTFLTIGAISVIYDLLLRRQIQGELLKMVNLQKSLAESQIKGGVEYSNVDWDQILDGASEVRCLLIEPANWIAQNWGRVSRLLAERQTALRVFLPDPTAAYISELADKLNVDENDYRAHLRDAASSIEDRWQKGRQDKSIQKGSSIEVRLLESAPSYSLIISGSKSVVAIGRALKRSGREDDFAVQFSGSTKAYPNRWFLEQFEEEKVGNIRFTDKVDQ